MKRRIAHLLACALVLGTCTAAVGEDGAGTEFFEKKIRPVLVERCYACHSRRVEPPKGGLRLDSRDAVSKGGESGAVIVAGKPDESLLIQALRYETAEMPPQGKLAEAVIADFVTWVKLGAPDPRTKEEPASLADDWEPRFQQRRLWWSAQPVQRPEPPRVSNDQWCRTGLDHFVLARLEAAGLRPAAEADRRTLARRLSFALTGLPPSPDEVERFVADASPQANEQLVERLLASPHFGERWARHWMDVVHYADTHGYEWDIPAKGAWMYRDYLIRAFNRDVPFRQLILEQIAGDLLAEPRVDAESNLNESLLGLVSLRLGERRHGDSAEFEGIHQEAIDNCIDTVSKAFQGTTVACARCHDHKLDAVAQSDYYAMAGVLMSSRWVCRLADARDPNGPTIEKLRRLKERMRAELAEFWLRNLDNIATDSALFKLLPKPAKSAEEDPLYPWRTIVEAALKKQDVASTWLKLAEHYKQLGDERHTANEKNLRLVADFTQQQQLPAGWNAEGFGLQHGFVRDGELVVADSGTQALRNLLPAGLYTHVFSPRLGGALRSPLCSADSPWLSWHVVAGDLASQHVVVDNALFPESRYKFLAYPAPTWHTLTTLPQDIERGRRIYVELNTKAFNNYYPPRVGLVKRYSDEERDGPRSWFGVSKVYAHTEQKTVPLDELGRFQPLFAQATPQSLSEAVAHVQTWFRRAVERWRDGQADAEDVVLLNWLISSKLLTNKLDASPPLKKLVEEYRETEKQLQPERVVGAVADFGEGRDERIAIRGSYDDKGQLVPRGYIRLLQSERLATSSNSGRLELARLIASPANPLTARVFVNRVWSYLFGRGLVTTVDDFGHLGETPSDPQLLDYLASRFVEQGWSVKSLVREIVRSAAWRQSGQADALATQRDPDNRLWHHYPLRRLEAEAIRDAMLAVSGRLDARLFGPPVDPYRASEDPEKRLFAGPIDGAGRRSVYIKMTLMEPPKFLALFNQPLPKLTVGHRDVTNVPDQALALLNDPLAISQAAAWAKQVIADDSATVGERIERMFARALARPIVKDERERMVAFVDRLAALRGVNPDDVLHSLVVWQDVAHAIYNMKEFIYVR